MTTAVGGTVNGSVTNRRMPIAAITAFVLITLIALGSGAYAFRSYEAVDAQAGTVAAQAATIAEQAEYVKALEDAAIITNDRLGVCLGSFNRNRGYAVENEQIFQDISDTWGVNYNVPLKGVLEAFDGMSGQLECA